MEHKNTDVIKHKNFKEALAFLQELDQGKRDFVGIDLTAAVLSKVRVPDGCNFQGSIFKGCRLLSADLSDCNVNLCIFDFADMQNAALIDSDCKKASFNSADLSEADFSNSRLHFACFRSANLTKANFRRADIRGADFRGAVLDHAEFKNAIFDDNTMFEASVDLHKLGMRKIQTPQQPTQSSPANSTTPTSAPKTIRYRGATIEVPSNSEKNGDSGGDHQTAQSKSPKTIRYRGAVIEVPNGPTPPTESVQGTPKPAKNKAVRTYRGVPIG